MTELEVIVADITTLDVDAIVNAANSGLLGRWRSRWRHPSGGRAGVGTRRRRAAGPLPDRPRGA